MEETKDKIYETTLENAKGITGIRRSGNTTRLIDNAIQIIYSGNVCIVLDHTQNIIGNQNLFQRIMDRIAREHRWMIEAKMLKIDKDKLYLSLSNEPILKPRVKLGTGVDLSTIDNH